ncbi:MBL fold metallo-hydrolase [Methanoregula sp.]|uniref:MBL fold metallo-hydrolase n=1 Tax=Methanoregula sp. TaxID=2052170 RepID=UPI0023731F99|nr:MBL fold metallo-hydrolase [Methanoregula sp.]MDD1686536.1 MBL fold metallo-hydrolase [Methanoregula sp.]
MKQTLTPADRVEVTVLVDNYIDIFVPQATPVDHRLPFRPSRQILAEHGFSCMVRIITGKEEHAILLDAGLSRECMAWNARQLGISPDAIEAVVLSHGHFDHTGGLTGLFAGAGRRIPLITHPDAFIRRRLNNPAKGPVELPQLDAVALKKAGADILLRSEPSTLAAGHLLVTGEVERKTPFEKGMPGMEMFTNGRWEPDPIRDDQALVINVKDKGLVVLSGCAHTGIINTVKYAQKCTGVNHIHAVLGGFHLTGPAFTPIIQPTIDAMKTIGPDYIVPMHCTGWDAINRFMTAMPEKCILNTVGTTYVF